MGIIWFPVLTSYMGMLIFGNPVNSETGTSPYLPNVATFGLCIVFVSIGICPMEWIVQDRTVINADIISITFFIVRGF